MRPLSRDLQEFIRLLNAESVEYLIVGAWALAFYGRPRYTGDVDIFLRRDATNAARMMRVIEAFAPAFTRSTARSPTFRIGKTCPLPRRLTRR